MLVNTSNYNEGVQKTMTNITKRSLVAAGVLAALMAGNVALAADVPAGVTLAEKQTNSWIRIRPLFLFITT